LKERSSTGSSESFKYSKDLIKKKRPKASRQPKGGEKKKRVARMKKTNIVRTAASLKTRRREGDEQFSNGKGKRLVGKGRGLPLTLHGREGGDGEYLADARRGQV